MDVSQAASLSSEDSVITVVLADDDRVFSAALQEVIVTAPQLRLVGLAGDATEAVALAERHRPNVAVLDVRMPGGGVEAAREMRRCSPATSIIALSAYEDRDNVASMVGAGAQAYLVKGRVTSDDVVRAIRQAAGRACAAVSGSSGSLARDVRKGAMRLRVVGATSSQGKRGSGRRLPPFADGNLLQLDDTRRSGMTGRSGWSSLSR